MSDLWPAPTASGPVHATVDLPGSKSQTNRALVLAAVADGPGRIRRPLRARDTLLMADALRALGVAVVDDDGDWRVTPGPLRGPATVHCGLAGTVMRFVPPLAALATGDVAFDGDPQARRRPLSPVLGALRDLGVRVEDDGRGGLPFVLHGTGSVRGGAVSLDAASSSQFVSGLLLAGSRYDEGLEIRTVGQPPPSQPHIAMTTAMLADAGVAVDHPAPTVWRVHPAVPAGTDVTVEPDLSNAAPFLAAALLTGGTARVAGWPAATAQPGDDVRRLVALQGATVTTDDTGLTATGTGRVLGIDVDMHEVGELVPTVAAVAAFADSPTTIRGVAHLRGHETDRLHALAAELNGLGGDVSQTDDGLVIRPAPLHGGMWRTYHDHRMATAGALVGLLVPGVLVEDVATTGKTLPGFVDLWSAMLGEAHA